MSSGDGYGPMANEVYLLGESNYPISQAAHFCNQGTEWTPLVMTLSSSPGSRELFADAIISQSATWAKSKNDKPMCLSEIEKLEVVRTTNHRYSGHPLQATNMSVFLFFFQYAAFDGTTIELFYVLHIPEGTAQTSSRTALILSIPLCMVFIMRVVSEVKKQAETDVNATQCLETLLDDGKYPGSFVKCTLVDASGKTVESHIMTHYSILSVTLAHKKHTSNPIILSLQEVSVPVVSAKPASVQPRLMTDPVHDSHVTAEMVDATE